MIIIASRDLWLANTITAVHYVLRLDVLTTELWRSSRILQCYDVSKYSWFYIASCHDVSLHSVTNQVTGPCDTHTIVCVREVEWYWGGAWNQPSLRKNINRQISVDIIMVLRYTCLRPDVQFNPADQSFVIQTYITIHYLNVHYTYPCPSTKSRTRTFSWCSEG